MSDAERRHALGLMRINHCGEVRAGFVSGCGADCARLAAREALKQAAWEETEHPGLNRAAHCRVGRA